MTSPSEILSSPEMEAVGREEGEVRCAVGFEGIRTVSQERLIHDDEVIPSVVTPRVGQMLHPAQIAIANPANLIAGWKGEGKGEGGMGWEERDE